MPPAARTASAKAASTASARQLRRLGWRWRCDGARVPCMTDNVSLDALAAVKARMKATWMAGDFGEVAKFLEPTSEAFVARRGLTPGTRVLDVACGSGNVAIPPARAGARGAGDGVRRRGCRADVVRRWGVRSRGQHVWGDVRAAARARGARARAGVSVGGGDRHGELDAAGVCRGDVHGHQCARAAGAGGDAAGVVGR